jgi:hypothetical protein
MALDEFSAAMRVTADFLRGVPNMLRRFGRATFAAHGPAALDRWRRFVTMFLSTLIVCLFAVAAFAVAIDPYDGGRFGVQWPFGISDEDPRTADVSRGRDQRFNAAVVGNSHGQLLDPARLSAGSGLRFVQLTMPGTGPREQLSVLRWFLRHHAERGVVVLVSDSSWCTQDSSLPIEHPFPFWLYERSNATYAAHLLQTRAVRYGWRRILVALGLRLPTDPAGYWDYELGRVWAFAPDVPALMPSALVPRPPLRDFPAIARLKQLLASAKVTLLILFPPVFVTELPQQGSTDADLLAECKGAFAELVDQRGAFLDFQLDGKFARDPKNFMDATHYRGNVARAMESRIVAELRSLPASVRSTMLGGVQEMQNPRSAH